MISVLIEPQQFLNEAKYVFQFLFAALGIKDIQYVSGIENSGKMLIHYGHSPNKAMEGTFLIHISDSDYDKAVNNPKVASALKHLQSLEEAPNPLHYLFGRQLASLEKVWYKEEKSGSPQISSNDHAIHCSIDIIASTFYLLNMENERRTAERDDLGRFQKTYNKLGNSLYGEPLVDHYLLLFKSFLKLADSDNAFVRPGSIWRDNHTFALALSHDVDRFRTWTYSKIKRAFLEDKKDGSGKFVKKLFRLIYSVGLKENWSGNFRYIIDLEKKYGGNSTFFFASKRRVSRDPYYKVGRKRAIEGFAKIRKSNCKIGLHGSIRASENSGFLKEEKGILEKHTGVPIGGLRQHYLRFDISKTLDTIAEVGFKYDSTLGFSNDLGYRCGTSLPFRPFNPNTKKPYPFLEIPLILMDTVLMLESKLFLTDDAAWEIIERHLEAAHQSGFCLTINWHNNNIHRGDVTGYTSLYEKTLQWASEKNAWVCSPDELCEWWDSRTKELDLS